MPKCIYCQQDKSHRSFSIEHIIPEGLGYDLKAKNLVCKECNQKLSVIDQALCEEWISSFTCVLEGKPLKKKKGKPERLPEMCNKTIMASRNKLDGSVVMRGSWRCIIHKDGQEQEVVSDNGIIHGTEEELQRLFDAPEHLEVKFTVPPPKDTVRYSRGVHKIAFNLFAIFFHKELFDPFFDPVRQFILDGSGEPRKFRIRSLLDTDYNNYLLITTQRNRACFVNFIVNRVLYTVSLAPAYRLPVDMADHDSFFDFTDKNEPPKMVQKFFPGKAPLCTNPGSTDIK